MPKKKTKLMPWNVQDFLKDTNSIAEYLQVSVDEYDGNDKFLITTVKDAITALRNLKKEEK